MPTMKISKGTYNPANTYGLLGSSVTKKDATVAGVSAKLLQSWYSQLFSTGSVSGLFIYQGAPATQAALDGISYSTAVSAVTGVLRYSDLLCYFPINSAPVATYLARQMLLSFSLTVARLSGTATWFILGKYYNATYPVNAFLSGSLGAVGSGADMELDVLNFTAGVTYKRTPIVFPLPNNLVY